MDGVIIGLDSPRSGSKTGIFSTWQRNSKLWSNLCILFRYTNKFIL